MAESPLDIFRQVPEERTLVTFERIFTKLPKVFIEGNSLVKIALTRNFVNCGEYISRSRATFEGCLSMEMEN